jgi:uncharacterized membrane protein
MSLQSKKILLVVPLMILALSARAKADYYFTDYTDYLTGVVSFQRDIRPIFKAKCVMCHGSGKMNPNDYSDYNTALASKASINQRVVVRKDMPMGMKMDQSLRDMVGAWIRGGAQP